MHYRRARGTMLPYSFIPNTCFNIWFSTNVLEQQLYYFSSFFFRWEKWWTLDEKKKPIDVQHIIMFLLRKLWWNVGIRPKTSISAFLLSASAVKSLNHHVACWITAFKKPKNHCIWKVLCSSSGVMVSEEGHVGEFYLLPDPTLPHYPHLPGPWPSCMTVIIMTTVSENESSEDSQGNGQLCWPRRISFPSMTHAIHLSDPADSLNPEWNAVYFLGQAGNQEVYLRGMPITHLRHIL